MCGAAMKLSDYLVILVVVAAVSVLAFGWRAEGIKRAIAEQAAEQLRHALADSAVVLDSIRKAYAEDKNRWAGDTLRLTQQIASLRRDVRILRFQGDSLESVLANDTSLQRGDSIAVLRQIADTRLAEARTCGVALDSTRSLFDGCTGLLARSDSLLARERGLRLAQERLTEEYKKMARPGFFARIGRGVPWLVGGFVSGVVVWELAR